MVTSLTDSPTEGTFISIAMMILFFYCCFFFFITLQHFLKLT